ncbi:twin-arginine translocase TatA/TatE family subunit [Microbacterium sediminicola]|uniref:Twin-arginine translocase TatA/TatE family subunit n=1 Tax=Microbacterium sediminicola TaxID=415210 RepID=A0ABN2HMQ5_9MICO
MFSGLTIEKLMLIALVAGLIIGPERLPRYAAALAQMTRRVRDFARNAGTRVKDEMGEDFDDVDWRTLDPRKYDPRRIIREALLDDEPTTPAPVKPQSAPGPAAQPRDVLPAGAVPPYDTEAT